MKRTLSILTALLMLLAISPAAAEATSIDELKAQYVAEFNSLSQQEEMTQLEIQIAQLELQRAQMKNDEAAISTLNAKLAAHEQTLADLAIQKEDTAAAIISAINQQEDELASQIESLKSAIAELEARKALLTQETALYQSYADAAVHRGELTGTGKGFGSDVTVTVTLNADGTIASITADCSGETAAIAAPCTEEAFLSQFIGKTGPFIAGRNIDIVSGATFTSKGIIEAVNNALSTKTLTTTAKGFASNVTVTATVNTDGVITDIMVDCSGETKGFGTRCADAGFLNQFIGKTSPFIIGKNIDGVSGATITSKAVIEAVNSLLPVEEPSFGVPLTAKGNGFMGNVTVTVTLNADGSIASITVDCSNEYFGQTVANASFLDQFIGKTLPVDDIDVVSGATITSNAVIKAVNSLLPAAAGVSAKVQTLTASAKGLMSTVNVEITVDAAGAITDIQVDCSGETRAIAAPCAEEPFLSQFVGRVGPFDDIDVVTGATYTSNAVINAVNSLFPIN